MTGFNARLITAALLLSVAASPDAHHGDSMYDLERLVTIRGVLTEVAWGNPHVELRVEGEDASGASVSYLIEITWPNSLVRNGMTQESFVTGELVEIEGHPSRATGRIFAWGRTFVRADGTVLSLPAKQNWIQL
jgi:hypothetical protein